MNIINRFTLRILFQNKIRTLVTIIGIALSVAMFTGVTSLIVSFQQYEISLEIAGSGAWHGRIDNVPAEVVKSMQSDSEITGMTVIQNLGAAVDEESLEPETSFIFLTGIDDDFEKYSPINLVQGRLPEDSTEIVISQEWLNARDVSYQIGDTLSLVYGQRSGGDIVPAENSWENVAYAPEETLQNTTEQSFQIVGICTLPAYQRYGDGFAGDIIFTHADSMQNRGDVIDYSVLMRVKHPKEISSLLEKYYNQSAKAGMYSSTNIHNSLLRYEGQSTDVNEYSVIYGMAAILMAIIMLGSISLIYNAFSISVSERTRQFGLLKSIGATRRQIRGSVFFEVIVLGLVGIPVGLLAGLGGIAVTLHFISKLLEPLLNLDATDVGKLHLVVTPVSVLIAIAVGFVTILLSAWLPARKAVKRPVMVSLRQSDDIRVKGKRLRTSPLTYRCFGFEGMLAMKNYKRNRRKYRATILSLFMSIVLFVTAASFCSYMLASITSVSSQTGYDISCMITDEERGDQSIESVKADIDQLDGVTETAYSKEVMASVTIPLEQYDPEFLEQYRQSIGDDKQWDLYTKNGTEIEEYVGFYFLEDDRYQQYLEEHHYNVSEYMDTKNLTALVWSRTFLRNDEGKIYSGQILRKERFSCPLLIEDWDEQGNSLGQYSFDLTVGDVVDEMMPLGVGEENVFGLVFVLPYRVLEECQIVEQLPALFSGTTYQIHSSDHKVTTTKLTEYVKENKYFSHYATEHIEDVMEYYESQRSMVTIVEIFSYGFIGLITLISLANVFNTISTNIALRRQEFAMLKSVGMTRRGFRYMMSYECLLFGFKGLLYGLPVSFVINYLMYRVLGYGIFSSLIIPWGSVAISVASVFLVVFFTMFYAYHKLAQDNPIDALRNENI